MGRSQGAVRKSGLETFADSAGLPGGPGSGRGAQIMGGWQGAFA